MKPSMIVAALAAASAAAGCSANVGVTDQDDVTGAHAASMSSPYARADRRLTVMTQNVYLGIDVDPIIAAPTAEDVPVAVAAAWQQLEANRFDERASAIADSIARESPDLVALQEVALFRRTPSTRRPPTEIDFLAILHRALARRSLRYKTAAVQKDTDVQVPMLAGFDRSGAPLLDLVQVIDRDVVLVRDDLPVTRARAARYEVGLPVAVGGAEIEIVRGWASVVVGTDGGPVRFLTTHLEDHVPEIQAAQAEELLAIAAAEPLPIVLAGDFNSRADGSTTPTYATIRAAGFHDAWAAANPGEPGFTCCRAADLRAEAPLTERLDIVFARARAARGFPGLVSADLVGEQRRDRTASGLWPSDHAGVVASFRSPAAW